MYPALSIQQALASEDSPVASDLQTLWVGGEGGMEADLVTRTGIDFKAIPAAGVHGVGLKALPGNLLKLGRGLLASAQILRKFQPDVLLFTGGYVAVPMALAARLVRAGQKRARSLVYIPDIEPGLALKALLRFCDHAALTNEESSRFVSRRLPSTITGYPLRGELRRWEQHSRALEALNLDPDLPVLLVMGGSKGAHSINQALLQALPELLKSMQVVHLSGQLDWADVEEYRRGLPEAQRERYHAYPYLHEEMGAALAAADLAVGRTGASSLGEFPFFGTPAVLAPYPYAWRYQRVNADYLVKHGAAVLLEDGDLQDQLGSVVTGLMNDARRLNDMRRAMQRLAHPEAASSIAGLLVTLAEGG